MQQSKRLPHGAAKELREKAAKAEIISDKEEQFCQAYLIDFNVSKAARVAGYESNSGYGLMAQPKIRKRIGQIRKDTGRDLDVTRERLMQELMRIIYADPRDLYYEQSNLAKQPSEWDDDTAHSIASYKLDLVGNPEIKRWDKLKAMELLSKMLGFNMPEETINKNINVNTQPLDKNDAINIAKQLNKMF